MGEFYFVELKNNRNILSAWITLVGQKHRFKALTTNPTCDEKEENYPGYGVCHFQS